MIPPLYKYLSVNSAKAVLASKTLRWSTPRTLNDPFDMQTGVLLDLADHEIVDLALKEIWYRIHNDILPKNKMGVAIDQLRLSGIVLSKDDVDKEFSAGLFRSIKKFRNGLPAFNNDVISGLANSKILCLSSVRDQQLMWAHYAEGQSGVALEFSIPHATDSPLKLAKPIVYVDNPPNIMSKEQMASFLSGGQNLDVKVMLDLFVYTKNRDWAYENEWRINAFDGRNKDAAFEDVSFYPQELVAVNFGCNTSEEHIALFGELAININPSVKFFKACKDGHKLSFSEL